MHLIVMLAWAGVTGILGCLVWLFWQLLTAWRLIARLPEGGITLQIMTDEFVTRAKERAWESIFTRRVA